MSTASQKNRTAFEAWIRSQPCPLPVKRYPIKEGISRPGVYFDTTVEFAWQAWLTSRDYNRGERHPPQS